MWRWVLLVALLPYSAWLILDYNYHFIDHVNLVFHEAGHVVFTPLGETFHFLGGTLGQLFFPAGVFVHFWRQGKKFEAGIGGVWFAESIMYTAQYMSDAEARILPLVGGGIHDWHFLFSRWGILGSAEAIGAFFHFMAAVLLFVTLVFMCRQLMAERNVEDSGAPLC